MPKYKAEMLSDNQFPWFLDFEADNMTDAEIFAESSSGFNSHVVKVIEVQEKENGSDAD